MILRLGSGQVLRLGSGREGFTLLEILITLFVVGVGLGSLLVAMSRQVHSSSELSCALQNHYQSEAAELIRDVIHLHGAS